MLPEARVVAAEQHALDDRGRLVGGRERQRGVDRPADTAADVRERLRDLRGRPADVVGVAAVADAGGDKASAVAVEDDRLAGLGAQLALVERAEARGDRAEPGRIARRIRAHGDGERFE